MNFWVRIRGAGDFLSRLR